MASSEEELKKALERFIRDRENTLGDFHDDCDFPLSQGYSLIGSAGSVSQGVCWAMSYDWARFQVYDYEVSGNRFYKVRKKTKLLQLFLAKARQKQRLLAGFARREGFAFDLLGEGTKPNRAAHPAAAGTLPAEYMVAGELIECCFSRLEGDRAGVRMVGILSADGGHEIAVRVKPPYRLFDPNYGQYTVANSERLKSLLRTLLLREYYGLMQEWDVYSFTRTFPARQRAAGGGAAVEIPDHVAGGPAPVIPPFDADAAAEAMLAEVLAGL